MIGAHKFTHHLFGLAILLTPNLVAAEPSVLIGNVTNCPVTAQYGDGWEYGHSLNVDRLPQLVSQYINTELMKRFQTQRFVEVVRTVVFTSARADTARQSTRMTMFREMEEANFEVRARAVGGGHPSARRGRPPSEGGGHPRPGGQHQRRPDAEGPPPPGSVSTPPRAPLPAACRCT